MSWADKVQEQSEEGQTPGQGKMGPQPRPDGPAACTSGMSLRPWSGDPGGAGACPPLRASVARVPHQRVWTPRAGHPPAPVLPTSPPTGQPAPEQPHPAESPPSPAPSDGKNRLCWAVRAPQAFRVYLVAQKGWWWGHNCRTTRVGRGQRPAWKKQWLKCERRGQLRDPTASSGCIL